MTPPELNLVGIDAQRLLIASISIAIYLAMCLMIARKQFIKQLAKKSPSAAKTASWQIIYASQTGTAEEFAQQTANTLHVAGIAAQVRALSALGVDTLKTSERILFIVSTYGEGNPPDNAALFAARVMSQSIDLGNVHYAMLALGDRTYTHFCGFARELDAWLQTQGAQRLFPTLEAHRCDANTIERWRNQLSHLAGTDDAPDWQGPIFSPWRLVTRRLLNAGSQGNAMYHLELTPPSTIELPAWESGDLAQIQIPDDEYPREYSIASIPHDGRVHLLIRLHRHADDSYGAASGWLTQTLNIGDSVPLRLRQHPRFRLGDNATRPLILIGNGSGIAGLRGHLKTRALMNITRTWLIFGERNAACDYHYRDELEAWHNAGILEKLDAVFSRDQSERRYVQDRLIECADAVRDWVNGGAAIYVCGSLHGMAAGVDDALSSILGHSNLEELARSGRYRRDVY
ncbi:MAG: sulfite reductase subunit alpha [Spongiibacteraceae bacterium]